MLIIMEVFSLSQRNHHSLKRLLQKCAFPQRFPLQGRKLKHVIQILIKFIHDIDSVIVDGTGVGYRKKVRLNWKREYLGRKGIKGVIRVRRNGVGREDVEGKNTKSVMR